MNIKQPAPVSLFAYNRPWHTQQTIEALQKNDMAQISKLFIFSDGPKNPQEKSTVQSVRSYLKEVQGFKEVHIIEREKNLGLADNIVDGVNQIVNEYGKIIVLEDDCITAPCFLNFINEALEFYQEEKKVWHISGWNYPIDSEGLPDTFLWRVMNCWGWGTWADRWKQYSRDPLVLKETFSKEDIKRFNLDGVHNFWEQVTGNAEGRITTWAIFWYSTIFQKAGLCLNATRSLVQNIGHDGSGTHCGNIGGIRHDEYEGKHENFYFPIKLVENEEFLGKIKLSLSRRSIGKTFKDLMCKLTLKA